MSTGRKRRLYAIITLVLLVTEVLIALFVHDNFIRPYIGDVLVVIVLYTCIRIIVPEKWSFLPLCIFLFAALVEMLQYFRIVEVLGLQDNRFFSVLMGTVFDWKDILCYGMGCVILGLYELFLWKNGSACSRS